MNIIFSVATFTFVLVFIFVIAGVGRKDKKIIINESVSDQYREKAHQLLSNNPKISIARARYKMLGLVILGLLVGAGLLFYLYIANREKLFLYLAILCFIGMIVVAILRNSKAIFSDIIPEVLKAYNNTLTYDHKKGLPSNIYASARFESYDRYHSEDLITGKIHDCDFSMCEVHTEDERRDSDGDTHYVTLFHGTFAVIKLNKNFGSFLNIVNNKIKLFSRDNYITLENTDFEKIYDVFTGDKIKAMRLLTPDVTTKMIDLYNETGIYCEIKISESDMYIRLYTRSLFSLGFSNVEKESKQIGACMAIIDSVFKITENFIKELERLDD